ncbi:class I SAM-dependent methyltransferase [Thermodesulfobacteriota bacterium]
MKTKLTEKEMLRIDNTVMMVPNCISSALEVGCGDGRVSNYIKEGIDLTGIDIDPVRIKDFPGKKFIGDISILPLKKESFDLVLACEVLEHLDDESLNHTIEEISRITSKYILVTVPYKETLSAQWNKCSECGNIYNAWGHLRAFDFNKLKNLFHRYELEEWRFLEPKEIYIPSKAYEIVKKVGNVWLSNKDYNSPCPKCGSEALESDGNIFGKIFIRLLWRFERYSPWKKPIWIGCLFKK